MNTNSILEKENATGHNQLGANANRPVHILTASSIIGDQVEDNTGENIGKIKDIMIDIQTGKIEYLIVEFGGFLGFGEKLFAIPFLKLKLHASKKNFSMNVDKSSFDAAPGFDATHWPETNSHYLDVDAYWGNFIGPNTAILSV